MKKSLLFAAAMLLVACVPTQNTETQEAQESPEWLVEVHKNASVDLTEEECKADISKFWTDTGYCVQEGIDFYPPDFDSGADEVVKNSNCVMSGGDYENGNCTCPEETPEDGKMRLNENGMCVGEYGLPGGKLGDEAIANINAKHAEALEQGGVEAYASDMKSYESPVRLSFEYPAMVDGMNINASEFIGPNGLTTQVGLLRDKGEQVTLSVELIDWPTQTFSVDKHLEATLLNGVENCYVEEVSISDDVEVYSFASTVSPFEDGFDDNCRLNHQIRYFPKSDLDRVVVVGLGQAPAFPDMDAFLNSIQLESIRDL